MIRLRLEMESLGVLSLGIKMIAGASASQHLKPSMVYGSLRDGCIDFTIVHLFSIRIFMISPFPHSHGLSMAWPGHGLPMVSGMGLGT